MKIESRLLTVLLMTALVLSLSACSLPFIGNKSASSSAEDDQSSSTSTSTEDVNFDLTASSENSSSVDLSSLPEYNGNSTGASVPSPSADNTLPSTGSDSALYEVGEDGYAYALDPASLEPYGPPLDPVTHEELSAKAIQADSGTAISAPEEKAIAPSVMEPTPMPDYTATAPTPENKYPNTGVFLEDD